MVIYHLSSSSNLRVGHICKFRTFLCPCMCIHLGILGHIFLYIIPCYIHSHAWIIFFWLLFSVQPAVKGGMRHTSSIVKQTPKKCTKLPTQSVLYWNDKLHISIAVGTPVVACCTLTADECCTAINQDQAQRKPKV